MGRKTSTWNVTWILLIRKQSKYKSKNVIQEYSTTLSYTKYVQRITFVSCNSAVVKSDFRTFSDILIKHRTSFNLTALTRRRIMK